MIPLPWVYDDGGRAAAGYRGHAGDCTVRAAAIATGISYQQVYDDLNVLARAERPRRGRSRSSARDGVARATSRRWLEARGWEFTATMFIGSGCRVHVAVDEVPMTGNLILSLSGHLAAVVNGVVHDTHDPSREGTRCVYGYWTHTPAAPAVDQPKGTP